MLAAQIQSASEHHESALVTISRHLPRVPQLEDEGIFEEQAKENEVLTTEQMVGRLQELRGRGEYHKGLLRHVIGKREGAVCCFLGISEAVCCDKETCCFQARRRV